MVVLAGAESKKEWCLPFSLIDRVLRSKKSRNFWRCCETSALHSSRNSNGEDVVKEVIHKAAAQANLPYETAPVQRHEANGRAEQKMIHVREHLQVLIEDTRARGIVFRSSKRWPLAQ